MIRRQVLGRTRRLSALASVPSPGLAPDYLVVELSLLGPFARVAEPLFICRGRDGERLDDLSIRLDPHRAFSGHETMFWWLFRDLWRIAGRYQFGVLMRVGLLAEFLRSAAAQGTLHDVLVDRNTTALRAVVGARRCSPLPRLIIERMFLEPPVRYRFWREVFHGFRGAMSR